MSEAPDAFKGVTGPDLDALLTLAERLADCARAEVAPHYRTPLSVEDKPDASPVTAIDRAAEAAMRRILEQSVPAHGVVGEEYGSDRSEAEFVWILDPVDGTKRLITGSPLFGALIALLHRGRPLLGIVEMPALAERWIGARGRPSLHKKDGKSRPVACRPCPSPAGATLTASSPHMFEGSDAAAFERLRQATKMTLYGGDCYSYAMLAEGFLDLVVEADMSPYDYLAQVPIIEGAGGRLTDWQGRPLGLDSDGRTAAAGDPALHEAALAVLAATAA